MQLISHAPLRTRVWPGFAIVTAHWTLADADKRSEPLSHAGITEVPPTGPPRAFRASHSQRDPRDPDRSVYPTHQKRDPDLESRADRLMELIHQRH